MLQFFLGFLLFCLGYLASNFHFSSVFKNYIFATSKVLEASFYFALKDFIEMHNYGIKALQITLEKCSEDDTDKIEEYQKIIQVYDKKFTQFGNFYISSMRKIFPYELKYNTYNEVKEVFTNLINKEKENDKNA